MKPKYIELDIEDVHLDLGNPRIKQYLEIYAGEITSEAIALALTIPEWSAVFMLCNVKSTSLYIQATFRAQNPCKTRLGDGSYIQKDNAYVFDFASLAKFKRFI